MIIQIFKLDCEECGKELESRTGVLNTENEIIVEFLDGMDFYCNDCDQTTYIEIQKYQG